MYLSARPIGQVGWYLVLNKSFIIYSIHFLTLYDNKKVCFLVAGSEYYSIAHDFIRVIRRHLG